MNDLSKINAYNKIPKSLIDFKNNYESYQSNSIVKSNNKKSIHHRKSNSLDVTRLYEIQETTQSKNNTQEFWDEESRFLHCKNTITNYTHDKPTAKYQYEDECKKDKGNSSSFISNRYNGYQSERKDDNITENSVIVKKYNCKVKSQNTSVDNKYNSAKGNKERTKIVNDPQLRNLDSTSKVAKKFNSKHIPIPNSSKVKHKDTSSIKRENKSPNTLKNSPITKNQMSNGSKTLPKTLDRLDRMYMKGLEKFEKFKKLNEEQTILRKQEEIAECTFKPKLNRMDPNKKVVNILGEFSIHERHKLWNDRKLEKIEKEKISCKIKEQRDCTFVPELNNKQLEFFNFDVKSDENVKRYIERLDKAKKLKDEINVKYNPDYNERYDKLMKNKFPKPTENTDDWESQFTTFNPKEDNKLSYNTARRNLHSRLHSIKLCINEEK